MEYVIETVNEMSDETSHAPLARSRTIVVCHSCPLAYYRTSLELRRRVEGPAVWGCDLESVASIMGLNLLRLRLERHNLPATTRPFGNDFLRLESVITKAIRKLTVATDETTADFD
jgi:hypothetical protein